MAGPAFPVRRAVTGGRPKAAVLVALCVLGLALWNFPLMILWDRDATVFGLPVLPVALFVIWVGLIAALAWVSERRE